MAHVLVVGGAGVLEQVSLFLASHDNVVTVVSRSQEDFEQLQAQATTVSGKINPIVVDYQEVDGLAIRLKESILAYGPVTLAVNWVQEQVLKVVDIIASILNATSPVCRYFQILPGKELARIKERKYFESAFRNLERVLYRIIVLGRKRDKEGTADLSLQEINDGVIKALRDDSKNVLIGTVDPWEQVTEEVLE